VHPWHAHRRAQLLYSATGVMIVDTEHGTWVVPPLRAVWIPGGIRHQLRMIGPVATRSLYLEPWALPTMPDRCRVVGVSAFLRGLLLEAVDLPLDTAADPRAQLIMALIPHEIAASRELPLCVPLPANARLVRRCQAFLEAPTAHDTIDDWSAGLHMSRRAFTRLFRRETGLSLGAWRQLACLVAALPRLLAGESVTSVALDLGYSGPAAFGGMFRRVLGAAPSRYLAVGDGIEPDPSRMFRGQHEAAMHRAEPDQRQPEAQE
jgi:AraC-like DNA-binding protein